jgi:hypothetical protein
MAVTGVVSDWKFWVLTIPAALLCILVFANIASYSANRAQQAEVVSRQQYINEAIQLSRFNSQFIQMLANLAAQTNDESLQKLLSDHGITYTVNTPPDAGQKPAEKKP